MASGMPQIVYLIVFILTYKAIGKAWLKAELAIEDFWKTVMNNTFHKRNSHLWVYFPAGFILLRAQTKAPLSLGNSTLLLLKTAEEGKSEVVDLSSAPYFVPLPINRRVQHLDALMNELRM